MELQEALENAHGTLIQLLEQYDATLPREDRVQMVHAVRDHLSVAKNAAVGAPSILNRIQELDDDLERTMNAPDNIMIELLESAADMSQDILAQVEEQGQMGGFRRRKRTLRKRTHRKRTLRVKRRKQTHRKQTQRSLCRK